MSQNNTIRKSDKKFIRTEKARIRSQFLDVKKQEELIDNLYKKFIPSQKNAGANPSASLGTGAESRGSEKTEEPKKIEPKPAAIKASAGKEKARAKKVKVK